jgi:DNA-binding response OmpR family regulator
MARQAGASAFATKPVHFEELLRYLASLPGAAAPGKMTVIE